LEAALKREAGLSIDLIEGSRGIFEVRADGQLIFSKKTEHRFPTAADIVSRLPGR
jgi:selT/selW/selH-like putative selenoprotein